MKEVALAAALGYKSDTWCYGRHALVDRSGPLRWSKSATVRGVSIVNNKVEEQ